MFGYANKKSVGNLQDVRNETMILKEDIDSCQFLYPGGKIDEEETFILLYLRYGIKIPQNLKNPNR